jgi:hypothetical protein
MVIAAFLGLSLLFLWGFASVVEEWVDGTGLDFWASNSGRLILAASSEM